MKTSVVVNFKISEMLLKPVNSDLTNICSYDILLNIQVLFNATCIHVLIICVLVFEDFPIFWP